MRHVWIGAAVTALLFTAGKTVPGHYLGRASLTSAYYAAQIVFCRAEFTRVTALTDGGQPRVIRIELSLKSLFTVPGLLGRVVADSVCSAGPAGAGAALMIVGSLNPFVAWPERRSVRRASASRSKRNGGRPNCGS